MSLSKHLDKLFQSLSREELEIRLRHYMNDFRLTKEEARENAVKYMDMVVELGARNMELQTLKANLEDILKTKDFELLLSKSKETPGGASRRGLKSLIATALEDAQAAAAAKGCSVSLSCKEDFTLDDAGPLPFMIKSLSLGMLSCCEAGAKIKVSIECSGMTLSIELKASGADRKQLSELLREFEPRERWEGPSGMLSSVSGWQISPDCKSCSLKLNRIRKEPFLN